MRVIVRKVSPLMDIVYFTDVESDTLHSNGMACILPITPFYSGENMRQTQ